MAYKRKRTTKAAKRSAKEDKRYPRKFFGRSYFQRGIPGSVSMNRYGETYAKGSVDQQAARRADHYAGKGGYWGNRAGSWLSGVTGISGLGQMGSNLENQLINKGVGFLNSYTGSGGYTENNSLVNPDGSCTATVTGGGLDSSEMTVSNKEYICDITGASSFTNQSWQINPGSATLFPWLSQIACNFDEYQFNQLLFGYKSVAPDSVVGSTQIGSVIMTANYNPTSPQFTNKVTMMEYEGSCTGKITDNVILGVECDPSKNSSVAGCMYVTSSSPPANQDAKSFFLAKLQVAVNQSSVTGQIGELWVTYSCTLRKKKLWSALCNNAEVQMMNNQYNGSSYTPTLTNIFGYVVNQSQYSQIFSGVSQGQRALYYYYTANSSIITARTSLRSSYTEFSNQFNLVWNSTTKELTLFFPDTYIGTHQMMLNLITCTTSATQSLTYSTNCSLYNTVLPAAITASNASTSLYGNVTQSAITAGIAGVGSAGTYVSFSTSITTAPSFIVFSNNQISSLA